MSRVVHWFQPEREWECSRCPALMGADDNPAAWVPDPEGGDGEVVCVDCGDAIEAALPPPGTAPPAVVPPPFAVP